MREEEEKVVFVALGREVQGIEQAGKTFSNKNQTPGQ